MNNKQSHLWKEQTTKENRIWVRIASACNEKCLFCLDADAQSGKLTPDDEVRKKIKDGYKEGVKNRIIISGGEASINPRFHDYIRYAKEVGYDRIQTVTNANMFARPEFCKKAFDAGLQEVTISLHGHTKELHDYLTATPGSFDKAIRALLFIRKNYPHIIINIDIVVNKVNVDFLPKIIAFYMKLGVHEFDILQIIPFGRGFSDYKNTLFYKIENHLSALHEAWKFSKIPGVYMWTNRFPVEAFEGYEELIQDPRKIKSETMGEAYGMFSDFITEKKLPSCYGEQCEFCFLQQHCHDFLNHTESRTNSQEVAPIEAQISSYSSRYVALRGEEFMSQVYEKFWKTKEEFLEKIQNIAFSSPDAEIVNVPQCIRSENNAGRYEWYPDLDPKNTLEDYTKHYIMNLYRKKSPRCRACVYDTDCQGIHINFIRSYGFHILQPISR